MNYLNRNRDIKKAKGNIPNWLIAEKLGIHENSYYRLLRKELHSEKKKEIMRIIEELKMKDGGEILMQRQTITVKEAAEYIGISKDLVYQLVRENQLPHLKLKRRILFRKAVIDQWMHNQEVLSFQYDCSIYSDQTGAQNNQGDC